MKKTIALLLVLAMMLGVSGAFAATMSIDTSALTSGETPVVSVTKTVIDENGNETTEEQSFAGMTFSDDENMEQEVAEKVAAVEEGKSVLTIYEEKTEAAVTDAVKAAVKAENPDMSDAEVETAAEEKKNNLTVTAVAKVESNEILDIVAALNEGAAEEDKIDAITMTVSLPVVYNPEEKVYPVLLIPTGEVDADGNPIYEEIVLEGVVGADGKVRVTYPVEVLQKMEGKECQLNIVSEKDAVAA